MDFATVPIDALIPYARNARTHSAAQVAQIAGSIREFGFCNPVLIDESGGIIAGHGRVLAARKLGLSDVPCIRLSHLSAIQRRAYVIADNRIAENAGWDQDMLAIELEELRLDDFDLDLTGFDAAAVDALLDEAAGKDSDPGSETPPSSAKEIDPDDYEMGHRCPRCGFEFDDAKA